MNRLLSLKVQILLENATLVVQGVAALFPLPSR